MQVVFVYGSLMAPEVFERVVGPICPVVYQDGTLEDHKRYMLDRRDYPGVMPCRGSSVAGKLVFNVDTEAMQRLDEFEGDEYVREAVKIATINGPVEAFIYMWKDASLLLQHEWSFDRFQLNIEKFMRGEFGE